MPDSQKLKKLVHEIEVAMLTTHDSDGHLRSRPMATVSTDSSDERDPCLWFFTGKDSPKASELEKDPRVNLSYGDPQKDRFVSVSGRAELVRDREKLKKYWVPEIQIWFPRGIDDPELSLLKVSVEQAEYWSMKDQERAKPDAHGSEADPARWDHEKMKLDERKAG
jgi:general stress protein 26